MIKANITEVKNRLSHYLRLVQGGEEIEILDRKTPLARIVRIGNSSQMDKSASWVKKMHDMGIIGPPKKHKLPPNFLNPENIVSSDRKYSGVLDALLEERDAGR